MKSTTEGCALQKMNENFVVSASVDVGEYGISREEQGGCTVAVVILTFNEEANICDCLDSIGDWASEIFIVDSYSADATIDRILARNDPRIVVVQHAFENYSKQWNWAIGTLPITAGWTLKLDADERLTDALKAEIRCRFARDGFRIDGFYIGLDTVFLHKRLARVGILTPKLRLWRTGACRFDGSSINEHARVTGQTGVLRARIDHHDHKGITEWLEKHNRYASLMALNYLSNEYKSEIRSSLFGNAVERTKFFERWYRRMLFRPLLIFLYMYVLKLGIIDGRIGLHYCMLRAIFFYLIDLKMLEARLTGRPPEVVHPMRGQPDPRLASGLGK